MDQTAARRSSRALLVLACAAIAFAAADTYVVVLALPDMMSSSGLAVDELQRAAPIVSGFLLGYVGILPLIGRVSDLRGRVPVLLGSLVVFATGSVVTAAAYDLHSIVVGRFVQGVGGGGLVPPTLALVADLWAADRRGLPLGVVGAVQELGSVLGPLYGAVVLAAGTWRDIFWINCGVGLVLAAAMVRFRTTPPPGRTGRRPWPDAVGVVLLSLALVAVVLVMQQPASLADGVTSGRAFLPITGSSRWLTPVAVSVYVLVALFLLRQATARRPLLGWRSWGPLRREVDLPGALLLALGLGCVIVAFASARPESAAISDDAPWLLPLAALAFVGFVVRQRGALHPLVPRGALRARPAWGAVTTSFVVGAALIAALVDIPFFARLTTDKDSQLGAALVLVRFLVALPVGALLGGWALRRLPPSVPAAVGMAAAAVAFVDMTTWGRTTLDHPMATVPLVVAGLGFGLAIAPVNAALLAHTEPAVHGVTSALLVVARMVGMLIGISALTTIGLHRFYAASRAIPPAQQLCHGQATACQAYEDAVLGAGIAQLHAVFAGAALCAAAAALLALVLLRGAERRPIPYDHG